MVKTTMPREPWSSVIARALAMGLQSLTAPRGYACLVYPRSRVIDVYRPAENELCWTIDSWDAWERVLPQLIAAELVPEG